jgi:sodium/potassium-transporting ATPase subunit beta
MGFRPQPKRLVEGSLIWYNLKNKTQIREYVETLDKFLEGYIDAKKTSSRGENQVICDYESIPKPNQVCFQEIKNLSPCTSAEGYGYERSTPCIFVKLNRVRLPSVYENHHFKYILRFLMVPLDLWMETRIL